MVEIDVSRVLCRLSELLESGCRSVSVGAGDWPLKVLVLQVRDGVVRAYVNRCPHAGHRLNLRPHRFLTPDGALIICASHGALFEREGGLCLAGPCAGQALTPLPVEIIGEHVLLAAGVDPAAYDLNR